MALDPPEGAPGWAKDQEFEWAKDWAIPPLEALWLQEQGEQLVLRIRPDAGTNDIPVRLKITILDIKNNGSNELLVAVVFEGGTEPLEINFTLDGFVISNSSTSQTPRRAPEEVVAILEKIEWFEKDPQPETSSIRLTAGDFSLMLEKYLTRRRLPAGEPLEDES
jgi:hypothetical protein